MSRGQATVRGPMIVTAAVVSWEFREGATALVTSMDDGAPVRDAREIAAVLVDAAIP